MSYRSLQDLLKQKTIQPLSDVAGVSDNVLSGEIGTHTNSAQITNSGNSNVTLNSDATARTANEQTTNTINGYTQDPNVNTQMLLNLLQPLLEVSKELNKTAINNLLVNNATSKKKNDTF